MLLILARLNLDVFMYPYSIYVVNSLINQSNMRFKDVNDYLSLERIIEENKRLRDRLETNGES